MEQTYYELMSVLKSLRDAKPTERSEEARVMPSLSLN